VAEPDVVGLRCTSGERERTPGGGRGELVSPVGSGSVSEARDVGRRVFLARGQIQRVGKKGARRELEKGGAGVGAGDCVTMPLRVPVRVPWHTRTRRRDISATTRAAWSTTGRPGESKPLLSSPVDDPRTYSHPANKQTTPPRSRTSVILPQAASCALPASPVHHACKKKQLFTATSGTRIAAALSPHARTACSSHRRPVAVLITPASSSPVVACLLAQHRHCPAGPGESALASP
jgi:hypothetical protein